MAMIDRGKIVLCGPLEEVKAAPTGGSPSVSDPASRPG